MYGLRTKRQKNPGYPDMPRKRNPNGPGSKAGKERARQEKADNATRREASLREVAALEHTKLAESVVERTPKAINRTLRARITENPTTYLSSEEEIEDPDEEHTEAMDINESGLDDESLIEPISDGLVEPGSEFDEDSENVRGRKLPVRIALTGYQTQERPEPIVMARPSNDTTGAGKRSGTSARRILSMGKRRHVQSDEDVDDAQKRVCVETSETRSEGIRPQNLERLHTSLFDSDIEVEDACGSEVEERRPRVAERRKPENRDAEYGQCHGVQRRNKKKSETSGERNGAGDSSHEANDGDDSARVSQHKPTLADTSEAHDPLSKRRPSISEWASKIPGETGPPSPRTISSSVPSLTHSKATRSQTSVPTSKRSALSANVGIRQPDDDDGLVGGLSDHDELQSRERNELQRTPMSARKRATYNLLVKSHVANTPIPSKSAAAKVTNNSLPKEATEGKTWSNVVIPTMIRWAGCQDSAWNLSEDDFLEALRITCQHYIDRIEPDSFSLESATYKLATQRLTDRWRSVIASSAMTIIHSFFVSEKRLRTDKERQEYAHWMLDRNRFVYRKARNEDRRKWSGLYQNQIVLRTFAVHFQQMKDAPWIRNLPNLPANRQPRAALALAVAAVKRGWTCWADGSTDVNKAGAAKDKAKENKKKGRKDVSKDMSLQTENVRTNPKDNVTCGAFSNHKWAGITDSFGKAIFRHISIDAMEEIMRLAQATRVDEREDKSVLTSQVDATFDEDDLVEGSEVSSESSADDNDPLSGWLPGPTKDVQNGTTVSLGEQDPSQNGDACREELRHPQDVGSRQSQSSCGRLDPTARHRLQSGSLTPPTCAQMPRKSSYSSFSSQPVSSNDMRRCTSASRRSGNANGIYPGTDKHDSLRSFAPQSSVQTNVDASSSGPSSFLHSYSSIDRQFSHSGHNRGLHSPSCGPLDLDDTPNLPRSNRAKQSGRMSRLRDASDRDL